MGLPTHAELVGTVNRLSEEIETLLSGVMTLHDRVTKLEETPQPAAAVPEAPEPAGSRYCDECNSALPWHFDNCPHFVAADDPASADLARV